MKLYFDNCCYNRPFDDLLQDRILAESNAVLSLFKKAQSKNWTIFGSQILEVEIANMKSPDKKVKVEKLYSVISDTIKYTAEIRTLAEKLRENANIKNMDSLHVASAEIAGADVFLSTDDKLIKAAKGLNLNVRVLNPITFLGEVVADD